MLFRYINPDEILVQPNIHLLCINRKVAVFVVLRKFENIFNTRVDHFLFESTFRKAEKLVLLPLNHFETLSVKLGDPKPGKVTLLSGTAR